VRICSQVAAIDEVLRSISKTWQEHALKKFYSAPQMAAATVETFRFADADPQTRRSQTDAKTANHCKIDNRLSRAIKS
jgi:hypothetical protein